MAEEVTARVSRHILDGSDDVHGSAGEQIDAESARLMSGEPQHGASARIFQFCTDLVVERALSSRHERISSMKRLRASCERGRSVT